MPKDQNALPRTPISMMSSPDKVADRARPPPESQNHRPPAARDRSIDRPREGLGDDRGRTLPYDDRSRKAVVESTSDRPMKPDPATLEERVSRPLENRISDRPHVPLEERIGAPSERSSSRPPPALQERISDRPALEERIGNRPASALDDRNVTSDLGRAAPSLESRLSQHSARDEERGRPANDGRTDERRPGDVWIRTSPFESTPFLEWYTPAPPPDMRMYETPGAFLRALRVLGMSERVGLSMARVDMNDHPCLVTAI